MMLRFKPFRWLICLATHGAFVIVLLTLAMGCGSSSSRKDNPLSITDVEVELQNLPRPLEEFLNSIKPKQNYFADYVEEWRGQVARDPATVEATVLGNSKRIKVQGQSGNQKAQVKFAPDVTESNVVALFTLISWDAWSSGSRPVRVTAHWMLYLDEADNIIGYFVRYPDNTTSD